MESMMPVQQARSLDAGGQALVEREVNAVRGAIVSAKNYPRDTGRALKKIEDACARIRLAEQALYSYPRGGETITGPSIRLAEVCAQNWGNIDFGWKEVSREGNVSIILALCWDLETNTRRSLEFRVAHMRDTKSGAKALLTERDIYEHLANQASRRVRNCVLAIIPGDIIEAAVEACERTMAQKGDIIEQRQKCVKAFSELGVVVEQIEKRLGHKITAMTATEAVQMRKIYQSIRDEASAVDDWFDAVLDPQKIVREQAEAAKEAPAAAAAAPTPTEKKEEVKQDNADHKNADDLLGKLWATVMKAGAKPLEILKIKPFDADTKKAEELWGYAETLQTWLEDQEAKKPKLAPAKT